MKAYYSNPVTEEFTVRLLSDGQCEISFFENGEEATDGESGAKSYAYDVYTLYRKYYPMIASDIAANKEPWYLAARAEDEARTAVDQHQLRADTDYLLLITQAPSGVSVLAANAESDSAALSLARKYYPTRWTASQLQTLVSLGKLSEADCQSIVGE